MMHAIKIGQPIFAITMAAVGILGLVSGDFAPIWLAVPKDTPARELLVYVCAFVTLASGIGLLVRPAAAWSARILLAYLLLWILAFRLPVLFRAPGSPDSWYGVSEISVYLAAALTLAGSDKGVRIGRVLYALAMIFFGIGHFIYPNETASFVPAWLPWHLAWAYLTAVTYIAAGLAMLTGILANYAAALSALQMGGFTVLIWVPIALAGPNAFQWSEFVVSVALTASGWVVADSYRLTEKSS